LNKRFIISWIAVCATWLIGHFVVRAAVGDSGDTNMAAMMRPTEGQSAVMYMIFLAHVLMAGAFVWIYQLRRETQPWLLQGLKFGIAISLLIPIPIFMIFYAMQQMPGKQAVAQVVGESIVVVLAAIVTAFVYRDSSSG